MCEVSDPVCLGGSYDNVKRTYPNTNFFVWQRLQRRLTCFHTPAYFVSPKAFQTLQLMYLLLHHVLVFLGSIDPTHHLSLVQNLVSHQPRLLGDGVYRPFFGFDRCEELFSLLLQLEDCSRARDRHIYR